MLKRILTTLVLVTSLGLVMSSSASADPTGWRWERCRFKTLQPAPWTVKEVHKTIHCAVLHWPVSHQTADYVAMRESGMRYDATNPSSGACGIYQHLPRYWPGRVAEFNRSLPRWDARPGCYNARANVLVAIRMAHNGGWGPWGF